MSGVSDLTGVFIAAGEGDPASFRYTPEISLEDQIQPIFNLSCAFVTCHASSATFPPEEGLILESGVSRENLVGKPSKQNPTLQLVEPDNPGESYLLQTLQGQTDILGEQMPLGGPYLSPYQINRGVKRTFGQAAQWSWLLIFIGLT